MTTPGTDCPFHGTAFLLRSCAHCRHAHAKRRMREYGRDYKAKRREERLEAQRKRALLQLDKTTHYLPEKSTAEEVLAILQTIKREFRP